VAISPRNPDLKVVSANTGAAGRTSFSRGGEAESMATAMPVETQQVLLMGLP
jgi:hypothetical protein